jgi:hypothetical protein
MRVRIIFTLISAVLVWLSSTGVGATNFAQKAKEKEAKNARAEQIVERTINAYFPGSGRAGLYAIQRNGTLRGLLTLISPEGAKREGKTVTKFIRKPLLSEDLLMIEVELPDIKYTIGCDGKQTWSSFNDQLQVATPEMSASFHASQAHSYEALLRYKENNAKLEYVSSRDFTDTSKLDIIDLVTPEGERTRYEINQKTGHILYLEYEMKASSEAQPTKYRLAFSDFKFYQNTILPSRTLVYENGRHIEERKLVEAVFNVQLEEKAFKSEVKAADGAIKP